MTKELIVITGASSGIGRETAQLFSKKGHPLLLLARRLERLEELKLPNTLCEKVDVTDLASFEKAIEKAEKKFGTTGCLVNNAGVMLLGNAHEQSPKEWEKMLDVNVKGLMNGAHSVLKQMYKQKDGTIINISSTAGIKTFPNHAAYCATKFAVHAFSEGIREEAAKYDVRVIVIAPGVVETELLGHTTSDRIKGDYQSWKDEMGQVLKPKDIAEAIHFAYNRPKGVCIREMVICPTRQEP